MEYTPKANMRKPTNKRVKVNVTPAIVPASAHIQGNILNPFMAYPRNLKYDQPIDAICDDIYLLVATTTILQIEHGNLKLLLAYTCVRS